MKLRINLDSSVTPPEISSSANVTVTEQRLVGDYGSGWVSVDARRILGGWWKTAYGYGPPESLSYLRLFKANLKLRTNTT